MTATAWAALPPQQFIDKRLRLTRDSGLVTQRVRSFQGVVVRTVEGSRKPEYDRCPYAHNKPSAAKACAEAAAKRLNRSAT